MKTKNKSGKKNAFERFALFATKAAGSTAAFLMASGLILTWLITGPLFGYSDTWQLVINTGTTIITFLMVFLIQKTQNKDSIVIQVKLNELVAADAYASNRIIDVEDLTEEELDILHHYYQELAEMTKKSTDIKSSHSVEEARNRHEFKFKKTSNKKESRASVLDNKNNKIKPIKKKDGLTRKKSATKVEK